MRHLIWPATKVEGGFMFLVLTAITGLLGGIVSSVFGVGGGVIFVPFLVQLRNFNPHLAVGTSLAVIVPTALVGTIKYFKAGMIDWHTVPWLVVLSLLGAWVGASLSLQLSTVLVKRLFGIFLAFLAAKMFFSN